MAKASVDPLEQIWWVTWTCGHRALLEETLPRCSWKNTLLVDYSCPMGSGDWAKRNSKVTIIKDEAYRIVSGAPIVSRARALNAALHHLPSSAWVLLADPHLYPLQGTRDAVMQAASVQASDVLLVPERTTQATLGVVVSRVETLLGVGGYLPAYVGQGAESIDLRLRASLQGVTIVPCDVPIGVATSQKVRLFGSQKLLDGRFQCLVGHGASVLAGRDQGRAKLLGLLA